jgi:hypothetical protein
MQDKTFVENYLRSGNRIDRRMVGGGGRSFRDAQRTSHDPKGSQEFGPPYFFSLTAERDDLKDPISETSQYAVSTNH